MFDKNYMEKLSECLRNILEISSDKILNPTDLDDLKNKITKFSCFKIVEAKSKDNVKVVFEKPDSIKIYLYGNKEKQFYDLVEIFTFTVLIISEYFEATESEYYFPRVKDQEDETDYLKLAFMMPRKKR